MRLITDVLREIRNGRAVAEATRQLADVVRAVDETGKAGEVNIKVKVKPEKGGGSAKDVSIEVKSKVPCVDLPSSVFYSDPGGDLHRIDPEQREMFEDADSHTAGRA
jgi:hypothetical protein